MGRTIRKSQGGEQLGHYPTQMAISECTGCGIWNENEIICGIGGMYRKAEVA